MGEGTGTDAVDAGGGDGGDGLQVDAAGGFELGLGAGGAADFDRLTKLVGGQVVEQDDVGAFGKHLAELVDGIDFNFDEHGGIGRAARRFTGNLLGEEVAGFADGLGGGEGGLAGLLAAEGQVVVFDEDRVVEAGAVVAAAAAVDGVFFEATPAGGGFAGVVNVGFGPGNGIYILPGERGDAGEAAE